MDKNTNMCKALTACTQFLKLGAITYYNNENYFITDNMVYCVSLDYKQILKLQSVHGTGKVTYCPFPTIICGKKYKRNADTIILNGTKSTNTDSIVGIDSVQYDSSKFNTNHTIELVSKSKMVILNGPVRPNILFTTFASSTPFMCVGSVNNELKHLLKLCDLSLLICDDNSQVLTRYQEIMNDWDDIHKTLTESVSRLIRFIKWAPIAKPFINPFIDTFRVSNCKLRFNLNPDDYVDPYWSYVAQSISSKTTYGGVHLRLSVVRDFNESDILLLHPWIGIVEVSTETEVKKLIDNKNFMVSLSMCLGLIVYSQEIADMLPQNINISIKEHRVVRMKDGFDLIDWSGNRGVIDLDTTPIDSNMLGTMSNVNEKLLLHAISKGIPVLTYKTKSTITILGEKYPYFSEHVTPMDIPSTDREVSNAVTYINHMLITPDMLIESIIDSSVGRMVQSIKY